MFLDEVFAVGDIKFKETLSLCSKIAGYPENRDPGAIQWI